MNELVFKGQNDQILTNSLLVAEKFGKEHGDVLKAIDSLIGKMPENQCKGYFAETSIDIQQPNGGLLAASVSYQEVPEISLLDSIRLLVNKYASTTNTRQQDVWQKVYEQLYYLYHISIGNYKKKFKGETKLEIAETNNILDKVFAIISNMVREHN